MCDLTVCAVCVCLPTPAGPFCRVCDLENAYFNDDEGRCVDCPAVPNVVGIVLGVLAGLAPGVFLVGECAAATMFAGGVAGP